MNIQNIQKIFKDFFIQGCLQYRKKGMVEGKTGGRTYQELGM